MNCSLPLAYSSFVLQFKSMRHRFIYIALYALLFCGAVSMQAQCVTGFTWQQTAPKRYTFTNTSTDTSQTMWYVKGPNIVYVVNTVNATLYFPVNGTYTVMLQQTNCGTFTDGIIVSGLTDTGTCQAAMTYYPTYGQNFEFDDASIASDSIVNYLWHGLTPDTFIQVNGWDKNTDLTLWSYNGCHYPFYIVTHTVTTISGCQSSIVDTVKDYCPHCGASIIPGITMQYDSITHELVFSDTVANGEASFCYWQFGTAHGQGIFSNLNSPRFSNLPDTITTVCLNVYDTINHCSSVVCDTISVFITTGVPNITATADISLTEQHGQLQIQYNNVALNAVEIYDVAGRRLLTARINASPVFIDLPALAGGIYFARLITAGNDMLCRKFFVR